MSRGLSRYTSDPAFLASVLTSPAPAARPSAASNTSYAPSSSSYPASNTPSTSSSMASTQPIQGRSITEQEIEGILRMASMSNSSVLTLSGHNLSDEHVVYFLADALVRYCISAANPWKVKEIHVSKCGLTMKGLEVLVHNALLFLPAIEVLKLTHNNFTRETGAVLAQYLQQTHANQLRVVDLSYNSLGDLGVTALSQAWNEVKPSLLSLHTLDLSHNDFGDAGILALCRGLLQFYRRTGSGQKSGNVGIKTLHLNGCKMTDRGAQCIAQLITSNLASSSRGSSPRPLASSSSSSSMASLASAINNNSAGYPLEELTLEACPCLSSTGIMLLFGDPHFSIASPLQRLSISKNTFLSLDLIQHLAYCIQYGVSQLEILYLDFTMEVARDVIKAALRGEHGGINLSGSIKELVDTLLNINHTRPVYMKRIQCGALHPILFETCIQMKEILQQAAYEDCLKALEYMNPAAQIFVIPYITNVSLWVRGKTYFNDLYVIPTPTVINVKDKTKEASPEKQRAFFPSNGNSPRASSATSNTSRQSTPTGLLAAGGIKSPTLHQQLQQEKEKIQKTVKYAPDVMPSNDQQAPQQSTMSTSHVDQSMMHADGNALLDMKTYANQHPASSEPANQNTTNSSQQVTQLAAAPLVVNSSEINVELLELKEQEYLRLRKSQSVSQYSPLLSLYVSLILTMLSCVERVFHIE